VSSRARWARVAKPRRVDGVPSAGAGSALSSQKIAQVNMMASYRRSGFVAPLLSLALLAGCSHNPARGPDPGVDGATAPVADLSVVFSDDLGTQGPCGPMNPCPAGQSCVNGACIDQGGSCNTNDDCEGDTYCNCEMGGGDAGPCQGGVCLPYGSNGVLDDPDCVGASFSPQAFKPPKLKCSWVEDEVIMTPLVIDLDRKGKPSIVFVTSHELVAISGKDCTVKWRWPTTLHLYNSLAAADLDGDLFPEIVGVDGNGHVVVHDHTGKVLATGQETAGAGGKGVPLIVDVDNKAPPEIIVDGLVSRYTKANGVMKLYDNGAAQGGYWGTAAAAADLDGDGIPEVVTGSQVYSIKLGKDITPAAYSMQLAMTGTGAFPAIADFNKDGKPDIALAQQGQGGNEVLYIWSWSQSKFIFGPLTVPSSWNGAPAIADLDGDKVPDIAVTGSGMFRALAMKCWNNPMAKGCESKGILWSKPVRDMSGLSGPSVFDLNGDGKVEVVYRDECFLRVLDGPTGKTQFLAPVTSGTVLDYPVVADTDVDGHADVVVPSMMLSCIGEVDKDTGTMWMGPETKGILVYQDPMNRWMPSRSIWNEHAYHITNVADNGTVPTKEAPNWKTWNNFRQNVQGNLVGQPAVDYTAGKSTSIDNGNLPCSMSERLWVKLCNRGTQISPSGVPGTFYLGDPRQGGMPVCTGTTGDPINPGECADLYCDWPNPPQSPQDLWFRADDDGKMQGVFTECHTMNDLLHLPGTICNVPG
jgi:hypothetical protein